MAKRSGSYVVPFSFELLTFGEAVGLAADTGRISGDAGPLLETVVDMLDELERPDEYFDCIQVAGTNGKTSTTRFSAAILRGEGLKTALYTSPQLVRYPERMEVDGHVVSDEAFARGVSAAVEAGRRMNARRVAAGERAYTITPFDLLTAAALVVFAEAAVDVAVLEVGMGGRWDATSATDPLPLPLRASGSITRAFWAIRSRRLRGRSCGHQARTLVVLGEGTHEASVQRVMDARCRECGIVPLVVNHATTKVPAHVGDTVEFSCTTPRAVYTTSMVKPAYQPQNAACAIMLCEGYLGRELDHDALDASLMGCPTPGRFDVLGTDPLKLIDACHNPQSCENFVSALDEIDPCVENRPALLCAALADKDAAGIVDVLIPAFPRVVVTQTDSDRALPAEELAALVDADKLAGVYPSVPEALAAFEDAGEPFVAAGTITLAGEVAGLLR